MFGYIIFGVIILVLIVIEYDIYMYIKAEKKMSEDNVKIASISDNTERLKIYAGFDFDKIDSRIDKYIQDAGTQYKINHFEYKEQDEIYLNSDEMHNMISEMTKMVLNRITPAVFTLIQMSYNIKDKEELVVFLCEKIKLYVLSYSLEVNGEVE